MAGIAASGIVLEPLTRDNYDNWSCLVKNYLVGHDLWGVVVEPIPTADERDQIWKMKNGKALHIIQLACGSENLAHITHFHTARDAFNYFRAESYTRESIFQSDIEQGVVDDSLHQYKSLHRFIESGNWNDAKAFMKRDETSMFSKSSSGRTIVRIGTHWHACLMYSQVAAHMDLSKDSFTKF